MPRPRLDPDQQRTTRLEVRVTSEERRIIQAAAGGQVLARWMRETLLAAAEKSVVGVARNPHGDAFVVTEEADLLSDAQRRQVISEVAGWELEHGSVVRVWTTEEGWQASDWLYPWAG